MARLDLHGFTIHDAWRKFSIWIQDIQQDRSIKSVTVVTGQGEIHKELPRWCDNMSFIREIQPHFSNGAYQILFYKNR
jgi:DNA-nicking Smr family endonuclease